MSTTLEQGVREMSPLVAEHHSIDLATAAPATGLRAPRKKASLDSLLTAVDKMQKTSLSSKTVSSKARTNKDSQTDDEE